MKRKYESRVFSKPVKLMEVLNDMPEDVEWSEVSLIPVFMVTPEYGISDMVGYRFIAYESKRIDE